MHFNFSVIILVLNYATFSNTKQTVKVPWFFENTFCKKRTVYVILGAKKTMFLAEYASMQVGIIN